MIQHFIYGHSSRCNDHPGPENEARATRAIQLLGTYQVGRIVQIYKSAEGDEVILCEDRGKLTGIYTFRWAERGSSPVAARLKALAGQWGVRSDQLLELIAFHTEAS